MTNEDIERLNNPNIISNKLKLHQLFTMRVIRQIRQQRVFDYMWSFTDGQLSITILPVGMKFPVKMNYRNR